MVRSKIEEEITILPTHPSVTLVMFTVVSSSPTSTAPVCVTLSSVPPGRSYLDHVDLFRCGGVIDQ